MLWYIIIRSPLEKSRYEDVSKKLAGNRTGRRNVDPAIITYFATFVECHSKSNVNGEHIHCKFVENYIKPMLNVYDTWRVSVECARICFLWVLTIMHYRQTTVFPKTHYQSKHSLQKNLLGKLPMATPPLAIVVLDQLQPLKQWWVTREKMNGSFCKLFNKPNCRQKNRESWLTCDC